MNQLQQQETGLGYIETVLRYLSVGVKNLERDELKSTYIEHASDGGEAIMTFAEAYFQEGKQEGRQETILKLLSLRFGGVPDEITQKIRVILDIEQLDNLVERAVLSPTLEVFVGNL